MSTDHADSGVQKFHAQPTPRIGGVALALGLLAFDGAMHASGWFDRTVKSELDGLLLAAIPAFAGGIAEDLTRKVGPRARLILTMVSGLLGILTVNAEVLRLDIPVLDLLFHYGPVAALFTMFAVGGVSNAVNIIDGFNGLASGVCTIMLVGVAAVAAGLGDITVCIAALAMGGVVVGFMCWNWPWGKVFLGDGGAYLLGFWVAELAILLVARHPQVTAWFAVILMIHPIFETLFSMYRRILLRGKPSTHPDAMHMHQLVYGRLVRIHVGSKVPMERTRRNAATAPYFWFGGVIATATAVMVAQDAIAGFTAAAFFSLAYVLTYQRLVRWSTPRIAVTRVGLR